MPVRSQVLNQQIVIVGTYTYLRDSYEGYILKSGLIAQVECKKPNKSR